MEEKDISIADLVKFHRGQASDAERDRIDDAIRRDPQLRQTYELIRNAGEFLDELGWEQLSEAALKLSDRMFDDFRQADGRGVLVFDSALLPQPEGVRPAPVGVRNLRYRIRDLLLDLSLYPITPDSFEILGQVSEGASATGALTISLRGPVRIRAVETDEFGLFRFERVGRGAWDLELISDANSLGRVGLQV